jgi:hypothetical protein
MKNGRIAHEVFTDDMDIESLEAMLADDDLKEVV